MYNFSKVFHTKCCITHLCILSRSWNVRAHKFSRACECFTNCPSGDHMPDVLSGVEVQTACWSGVGVTKPISSVPLFSDFFNIVKLCQAIEYHVYIWQVSPQLSCGDTCQIWMWFEESNMYFCHVEKFAYGEINQRSFSNPHPWSGAQVMVAHCSYQSLAN